MGTRRTKNQQKKRKINNHYANQEKKRQKVLEEEKQKMERTIEVKIEKGDVEVYNIEKGKEKMPETIVTGMQTSHPSEVTSDSTLELELLRKQLKKKEEELELIKLKEKKKIQKEKRIFAD